MFSSLWVTTIQTIQLLQELTGVHAGPSSKMKSWLRQSANEYKRIVAAPKRSSSSGGGCGPNCAYANSNIGYGFAGDVDKLSTVISRHYRLDEKQLSAVFRPAFRGLSIDAETQQFLKNNKPNWFIDLCARVLRWFMSLTDANAMLGRGQMFVISSQQARELLAGAVAGQSPSHLKLLDVGAGDGGVTSRLAPMFGSIHATEVSAPMCKRLKSRGYEVTRTFTLASHVFPADHVFDVVSIFNVLDRCDHPLDLLRDAARLVKTDNGRILIAVVLPFSEFVEDGTARRGPHGALPMKGARCGDGVTFEASLDALLTRAIVPLGLVVERIARVPYLCRGDSINPFYVLSDAIIVLRHQTDAEKAAGVITVAGGSRTELAVQGSIAAAAGAGMHARSPSGAAASIDPSTGLADMLALDSITIPPVTMVMEKPAASSGLKQR